MDKMIKNFINKLKLMLKKLKSKSKEILKIKCIKEKT
jgi:hypothetical protein